MENSVSIRSIQVVFKENKEVENKVLRKKNLKFKKFSLVLL